MAVPTYSKTGTKSQTPTKLNEQVFDVEIKNHQLLQQAYQAYLSNGRAASAKTKSRGEVRGGGAKPWRQKGTGRARFGSSRNPIWTGGGVAFGPTGNQNFITKMPIQSKRLAIRQALTLAAKETRIKVIESLNFSQPKTKLAKQLLGKIDASGSVLVVVEDTTAADLWAIRNLPDIKSTSANYLNVFDILNADQIVITRKALAVVDEWLGGSNG